MTTTTLASLGPPIDLQDLKTRDAPPEQWTAQLQQREFDRLRLKCKALFEPLGDQFAQRPKVQAD
jgi:hypothetical protein